MAFGKQYLAANAGGHAQTIEFPTEVGAAKSAAADDAQLYVLNDDGDVWVTKQLFAALDKIGTARITMMSSMIEFDGCAAGLSSGNLYSIDYAEDSGSDRIPAGDPLSVSGVGEGQLLAACAFKNMLLASTTDGVSCLFLQWGEEGYDLSQLSSAPCSAMSDISPTYMVQCKTDSMFGACAFAEADGKLYKYEPDYKLSPYVLSDDFTKRSSLDFVVYADNGGDVEIDGETLEGALSVMTVGITPDGGIRVVKTEQYTGNRVIGKVTLRDIEYELYQFTNDNTGETYFHSWHKQTNRKAYALYYGGNTKLYVAYTADYN